MSSNRRVKGALAASAAAALLVAPAGAHADSSSVTSFPVTDAYYNDCNGEMVIVNADLVVSTKLTSKGDKLSYEMRTRYENVSAASDTTTYKVELKTRDEFRTTVRAGQEKIRSLQSSVQRFKPLGGKGSELRVTVKNAYETDTATGETLVREDSYESDCK